MHAHGNRRKAIMLLICWAPAGCCGLPCSVLNTLLHLQPALHFLLGGGCISHLASWLGSSCIHVRAMTFFNPVVLTSHRLYAGIDFPLSAWPLSFTNSYVCFL